MSYYQQRIGLDPIEQRSGGSLPPTGSAFHTDPIEQRSGGSLPPTSGFSLSPMETSGGGSLAPTGGLASIYDMFFGGE